MRQAFIDRYADYMDIDITAEMEQVKTSKGFVDLMTEKGSRHDIHVLTINMIKLLGLKDVCRAACMLMALYNSPDGAAYHVCKKAGVSTPSRIRAAGTESIVKHLMSKYHTPRVYATLNAEFEWSAKNLPSLFDITKSAEEVVLDCFKYLASNHPPDLDEKTAMVLKAQYMVMLYQMVEGLGLSSIAEYILDRFTEDEWQTFESDVYKLYFALQNFRFDSREYNRYERATREQKTLTRTIEKQSKKESKLREELKHSYAKEKKLRKRLNIVHADLKTQVNTAFEEIYSLTEEVEEKDDLIETMKNKIALLERIITENKYEPLSYTPLKDITICVVGDVNKKDSYEELITRHGGEFVFYPSTAEESLQTLPSLVKNVDIIMYLSCYSTHTIGNKLKACFDKSKIVYLNKRGLGYFESQLHETVVPLTQVMNLVTQK